MQVPANTRPILWGAVGGAVLCAIVGFTWGGWVTGGSARQQAVGSARDAIVAALAPICAERFRAQADGAAQVAALAKSSSWERGAIVEKSRFALMPGSKTVNRRPKGTPDRRAKGTPVWARGGDARSRPA